MLEKSGDYGRPDPHSGPVEFAGVPSGAVGGMRDGFGNRESGSNLADYWRLALKHRWLIAAVIVAALVVGTAVTLLTTPVYTASATMQIDREAARVFEEDDGRQRESLIQGEEFFQTQYGLLQSRSLAQRVIQSLGLANSDAFLVSMGETPPDGDENGGRNAVQKRQDLVLKTVQDNLSVSPQRGSRLVSVNFSSPDPALSARVANAFATNFIASNLDRKFESSRYAREFLEERIAQTKAKLEDAERQLVVYATQQQIINVTESDGNQGSEQSLASNNLTTLNSALAQAKAARVAAQEKWAQASRTPLLSLADVLENPTVQRLTEERAKLEAQYQQNLNVYRPDFPMMIQLRAQIDELDGQITTVGSGIRNSIRGQYQVALNQERSLEGQVNILKSAVLDYRGRSIQYNILQREVDTSRTLYDGLLQRYKEVGVTGGVTTNNVSIVDEASPPNKPTSPKLLLNLALALILGLGMGVLAAFILEALDESVVSPDDVETKLGVTVLGAVPRLDKEQTPAQALADLRSPFSEAYYSLRTALQFSTAEGAPRTVLVTSSRPAEGKSTTAYAVAHAFARIGKSVLLVDGDLRNPSMHRVLGVDNNRGVSNVLSGSVNLEEVIHQTGAENLSFVSCGPLPPNPAELWGGDRVRQFLQDASSLFDHVIIDGPPVLGFADAPILAATVGGTLFVIESKGTRRGQARGALRRLQLGRGHLLGVVLTKFNAKATSYGGYDYSYDYNYGATAESSRREGRKARIR